MATYRIDEGSQREIQSTVNHVKNLTRTRTSTAPHRQGIPAQPGDTMFLDFAKITEAGADSKHWKWKVSLRNTSTGAFTSETLGSDQLGECVIADGAAGFVGMTGLLYWQLNADLTAAIIMVRLSPPAILTPITLTSDGGADGDDTTAPTYTYGTFINAITGDEIKMADGSSAAGQSPAWARSAGSFNVATHGTIYMNSDGDPVLWQVDETEIICDEEEE